MQIIRFYSLDTMLEPLAKYRTEADKLPEDVKILCRDLVAGIHDCPDIYEFMNTKFAMLDRMMGNGGFERMELVDPANLDAKCTMTFDIVVDINARQVKIFTFNVKPHEEEPFYLKALDADKTYVLGAIIQ